MDQQTVMSIIFIIVILGFIGAVIYLSLRIARKSKEQKADRQAEQLRQYKELLDEGIITEEEFAQKKRQILTAQTEDESLLWLWFLISFFFQIVGIVLFIIWREEKPKTAKYCLIGALVPIAAGIAVMILGFALNFEPENVTGMLHMIG